MLVSKLRRRAERLASGQPAHGSRAASRTLRHVRSRSKAKELHAEHYSLREIANELFAEGHANLRGKPFSPQSISNMLR